MKTTQEPATQKKALHGGPLDRKIGRRGLRKGEFGHESVVA